jgi:hypothetical protein
MRAFRFLPQQKTPQQAEAFLLDYLSAEVLTEAEGESLSTTLETKRYGFPACRQAGFFYIFIGNF